MTSARFAATLVRGFAAVALATLTIALLVVAPAQLQVRVEPQLVVALSAAATPGADALPQRITRDTAQRTLGAD